MSEAFDTVSDGKYPANQGSIESADLSNLSDPGTNDAIKMSTSPAISGADAYLKSNLPLEIAQAEITGAESSSPSEQINRFLDDLGKTPLRPSDWVRTLQDLASSDKRILNSQNFYDIKLAANAKLGPTSGFYFGTELGTNNYLIVSGPGKSVKIRVYEPFSK